MAELKLQNDHAIITIYLEDFKESKWDWKNRVKKPKDHPCMLKTKKEFLTTRGKKDQAL